MHKGTSITGAVLFASKRLASFFRESMLAMLGVMLLGCSGESTTTTPPQPPTARSPTAQPPPPIPQTLLGYGCYDIAGSGALRDALVSPILQLSLPQNAQVLIRDNLSSETGALRHVVQTAKVCVLVLEHDQTLFAVRSTGGRSGDSIRVFGSAGRSPAVTVFGSEAALEEGAAYLARVVYPAHGPVLSAVTTDALGHRFRRLAEAFLSAQVSEARAAIARERQQHDGEALFGNPDVLVTVLERRIRRALAYLPDLGAGEMSVRADGGVLLVDLEFAVHGNSPLAQVLAAEEPTASTFEHLPLGTALAYQRACDGAPPHDGILGALVEVAGGRLENSAAAQWLSLADAMPAPFEIAFGATPASRTTPAHAWLQYKGALDVATLSEVMQTPYAGTLIAGAFASPDRSESARCAPHRWPAEGDTATADCIRPAFHVESTGLRLGSVPSQHVSTVPDIGRLTHPEAVLAAVYFDAKRLPAAMSLFGHESQVDDDLAAPVLARLVRTEEGFRIGFRLAPHAVPALMTFVMGMTE